MSTIRSREKVEGDRGVIFQEQPLLLVFRCHGAGNTRVVKPADAKVTPTEQAAPELPAEMRRAAERAQMIVSKRLMDCPEVHRLSLVQTRAQRKIEAYTVPSYMAPAVYAVKPVMVPKIEEYLREWEGNLESALDDLNPVYDARIQEQADKLGAHFNEDDYPSFETFRAKWWFERQWVQMTTPDALHTIDQELWKRERDIQVRRLESAAEMQRNLLRAQFLEIVRSFREMVEPGEDGKTKKFTQRTVKRLRDFRERFDMRDLTGDGELDGVMDNLTRVVEGISTTGFRDNESVRAQFNDETRKIATMASGLVQKIGRRVMVRPAAAA